MPRSRKTSKKQSHPFTDAKRGQRLQRVLADAGVDSRRHCEEMIEEGRVRVNEIVVSTMPAWVDPVNDRIEVDGRPIRKKRTRTAQRHHYIMLNKPMGVVATNDDEFGRPRAVDLVELPGKPRLFCVGRLDIDSTGLLLLTDDGELANRLTHPRYGVHKTYELVVKGQLDAADVRKLHEGIVLFDKRNSRTKRTAGVELELLRRDRERTHLLMHMGEGRNRQIRRMMAALDYPVKKLRRIQMGPLKLSRLALGQWRPLTTVELAKLRKAGGIDAES